MTKKTKQQFSFKQPKQRGAPAEDQVEMGQAVHTLLDVARNEVEKVPATQLVQVEDWAEDQVPAMQLRHTELDVAPNTEENVPAGQLLHTDAPSTKDHEPSGQ